MGISDIEAGVRDRVKVKVKGQKKGRKNGRKDSCQFKAPFTCPCGRSLFAPKLGEKTPGRKDSQKTLGEQIAPLNVGPNFAPR